jgi:hypothetical protein
MAEVHPGALATGPYRKEKEEELYIVTAELQDANVAFFKEKSSNPDVFVYPYTSQPQLIWVSGGILYSALKTDKRPRTCDP